MPPVVCRRWRNVTGCVEEKETCYRTCGGGGEMLPVVWRRWRNVTGCVEEAEKCYRSCGGGG